MLRKPLHVASLDEAREAIRRIIHDDIGPSRSVVAIGGPVGSGKSTLASQLGGLMISTDHYLPDYAAVPDDERDEPAHADLSRLAQDLTDLRQTGQARIPLWCFQNHRRVGEWDAVAMGRIICEGIFALHPAVAHLTDIRVLVQAGQETRWKRWERIEELGERGMGVETAREHFDAIAEPTYHKYAPLYEANLDLIVHNEGV